MPDPSPTPSYSAKPCAVTGAYLSGTVTDTAGQKLNGVNVTFKALDVGQLFVHGSDTRTVVSQGGAFVMLGAGIGKRIQVTATATGFVAQQTVIQTVANSWSDDMCDPPSPDPYDAMNRIDFVLSPIGS